MTVESASVEEVVRDIIDTHRRDRGALLPILHAILAEFGYIDQAVLPLVAKELNISRADVHGVVSVGRRREPGRAGTGALRPQARQYGTGRVGDPRAGLLPRQLRARAVG